MGLDKRMKKRIQQIDKNLDAIFDIGINFLQKYVRIDLRRVWTHFKP